MLPHIFLLRSHISFIRQEFNNKWKTKYDYTKLKERLKTAQSETTETFEIKLGLSAPCMVLYKVYVLLFIGLSTNTENDLKEAKWKVMKYLF